MLKVQIYTIGKHKESWLKEGLKMYQDRLKGKVEIFFEIFRNNEEMITALSKVPRYICLDPLGERWRSEDLSNYIYTKHEGVLVFVIGGPEGLPDSLISGATKKLSFSSLTFTHQNIRLMLIEQLYRSYEIFKGSLYHKA
ncbi:MAG: 23S rRNA (pseudouridine(1915)-N(3))-methyltransferase RlmH [Chlamydiae bacterium]|nr:23S rRNA (pseudouridine(1915)-N(3))-methyltransferase RlmH [Chlamydiota bacterium]